MGVDQSCLLFRSRSLKVSSAKPVWPMMVPTWKLNWFASYAAVSCQTFLVLMRQIQRPL
nr:uncharacterized protein CTRU02_04312 [Colletotrichum truncatum]KAF6795502.1 hypothetical protein CTRU02_04312 [Colletotrichum truncatum]